MITKFFYKLLQTKRPNFKTATDREKFIFVLKYLAGRIYFEIMGEYHKFISLITKYYPFSLLYRTRLIHAANKPYSDFMWTIEGAAKEKDINVRVWNGHGFGEIAEFYGVFVKRIANKSLAMTNLEKVLQDKFGTVDVRKNPKGFKIIVPTSLIV